MDDIKVIILDKEFKQIKPIFADVQEYNTEIEIEDFKFTITKRLFIDFIDKNINLDNYINIKGVFYKIMKVKEFSDYMEVWLYKLKRAVV